MATTLGATFTTTQRMSNRIHCSAAVVRPAAQPSTAPGFAERNVHVVLIAQFTDGGPTFYGNTSHFTRGQSNLRPSAFASGENRGNTGRASDLPTMARHHFDIVDLHAQWHSTQG